MNMILILYEKYEKCFLKKEKQIEKGDSQPVSHRQTYRSGGCQPFTLSCLHVHISHVAQARAIFLL